MGWDGRSGVIYDWVLGLREVLRVTKVSRVTRVRTLWW